MPTTGKRLFVYDFLDRRKRLQFFYHTLQISLELDGNTPGSAQVGGEVLGGICGFDFTLVDNDNLVANHGKGLETAPLKKIIADEKAKVEKLVKIENIPAQYQKEYDKLVAEFKKTAASEELSVQVYRTLSALANEFTTFRWKVKLENGFN